MAAMVEADIDAPWALFDISVLVPASGGTVMVGGRPRVAWDEWSKFSGLMYAPSTPRSCVKRHIWIRTKTGALNNCGELPAFALWL